MRIRQCGNCKYHAPIDGRIDCRKEPPTVLLVPERDRSGILVSRVEHLFPKVNARHKCRHHKFEDWKMLFK